MKLKKVLSDYFQNSERKYIDLLINRKYITSLSDEQKQYPFIQKRGCNQLNSMKMIQQKYSEQTFYIVDNKQHVLSKFLSEPVASSEDNQCYYITPRGVFSYQSNIYDRAFLRK